MKIRYATKKEKSIAIKHWKDSFTDSENEIDFYFNNIYDNNNHLVLEKNKEIVSSLHENPYILNINKEQFKTKYIVGVATLLNEQKKGYMSNLISTMLKNLKEKDFPFIFLTPINPDIYRRYGFEYFSRIEKYEFLIENIEEVIDKKNYEFKEITLENYSIFLNDFIEIYNFCMKENLSYLHRDKYYFTKLLKECFNEDMKIFIQYENKIPVSYIIFSKYDEKIEIRECQVKKYNYYSSLLSLLYGYKDYYKKVELYLQENSNLEMIFKNQLNIKKSISPFMMLRILKPLEILNTLNIKLNAKIYLKDEILTENTGIYSFDKEKNIWTFSKEISENYTFEIKISDFSSLLLGFYNFDEMIFMDKIKLNKVVLSEINKLKSIFIRKKSYLYEFQ